MPDQGNNKNKISKKLAYKLITLAVVAETLANALGWRSRTALDNHNSAHYDYPPFNNLPCQSSSSYLWPVLIISAVGILCALVLLIRSVILRRPKLIIGSLAFLIACTIAGLLAWSGTMTWCFTF
jgi:hypothetical protein